ncbi:NifU family protein [Mesorhizobium sp. M0482]|uniref:NifU family protein n=1 Tax=unclassified Mesorhizobium TaxID=325217 RepID=UPI0033365B60
MFGCPCLRADGGDCGLVHVDADPVYVKLSGVCAGCQFGPIINGIRQRLNESDRALASFRSTEDRT